MFTCNLVTFAIVIIRYSLSWRSYLIPGIVEQLSLIPHERRRLSKEADTGGLDVLQLHHVDGWQHQLLHLVNPLFVLALFLALLHVEFDWLVCWACQLWEF